MSEQSDIQRRPGAGMAIAEPAPAAAAICPEARAELARLFQYLRTTAARLADALPDGPVSALDDARLLGALCDAFDAMAGRIHHLDRAQDTWPDLADLLFSARDMAAELRREGGPEQTEDAAHLLVQIRKELETRLAA